MAILSNMAIDFLEEIKNAMKQEISWRKISYKFLLRCW